MLATCMQTMLLMLMSGIEHFGALQEPGLEWPIFAYLDINSHSSMWPNLEYSRLSVFS